MIWIWLALVAALVAMLVLFAVSLVRKSVRVFRAFSNLAGQAAVLDGVQRAEPDARPVPAVIAATGVASARWRSVSHRRRERRADRHRRRLDRARRIIAADVSAMTRLRA